VAAKVAAQQTKKEKAKGNKVATKKEKRKKHSQTRPDQKLIHNPFPKFQKKQREEGGTLFSFTRGRL